jgi:hypothetical protein
MAGNSEMYFAGHSFFCINNLALRGSNDKIGAPNAGVFLDIMEVIIYHSTALKGMISKHNAGSVKYFSNKIKNEFFSLLGNKVLAEIIAEIKKNIFHSFVIVLLMFPITNR